MLHPVRALLLAALAWAATLIPSMPAQAQTEVDLALVIAVDISYSMDTDEQELQREGFAEAFRSPLVHDAIRHGMLGRIGVTYMEWAGAYDQQVILPWTVLDNSESLMAFADRIASTPLRRAQRTSVSGAIDAAANLFDEQRPGGHPQGDRRVGRRRQQPGPPCHAGPRRGHCARASRSTACRSC